MIGGLTVTMVVFFANKGNVFLAALISTVPILDMLPILFVKKNAREQLTYCNFIANIGVVLAMFTTYLYIKNKNNNNKEMAADHPIGAHAIGVGIGVWVVYAVIAYFYMQHTQQATSKKIIN